MEWSAIIRHPRFVGNGALTTGRRTHFEVVDGTESLPWDADIGPIYRSGCRHLFFGSGQCWH
jgi:hypothetical protein